MEEIITTISEDLGFKSLGAKVILPPFPNEKLPLASLNDFKINNEAGLFVATCSNQVIFGDLQKLRDFILSENDTKNDLSSYNLTILNDIIEDDNDNIISVDILYHTKQIVVVTLYGKLFFIDFETPTTPNPSKQIDSDIKILKCLIIADTLYYIDSNHSLKCFQLLIQDDSQMLISDNVADFDKTLNTNELVVLTRNDCKLQFYHILRGTLSLERTLDLPEEIISTIQENDDDDECISLNVVTLYHKQYLLVFGNSPNPNNDGDDDNIEVVYNHRTYMVKFDSDNKATYYETFDLAPAFGVIKRVPSIYNILLPDLVDNISNFNIITSSCSTELSIWDSNEIVQPDQDSERAVLPISKETDNDTCPVGMALDYSTVGSITEPCSGVDSVDKLPLIYVLNNEGRLQIWGFYHSHAIKQKTFHVEKVASFFKDQNVMVLPDTIEEKQGERDVDTINSNRSDESSIFTKKDDRNTVITTNEGVRESVLQTEPDLTTSNNDDITNSMGSFSFGQTDNSNNSTDIQKPAFSFGSLTFGNSTDSSFKIMDHVESNKPVFGSSTFNQNNNNNPSNNKTSAFGVPSFNQSSKNGSNSTMETIFGKSAFGKPLFGQLEVGSTYSLATESVFGKPAFGKPSFRQSDGESTNNVTTEFVFGKPVFGKPSFGQSDGESANNVTTESVFGKPAFGNFSFNDMEFDKSPFASIANKKSPFANLSNKESPFASIANKESPLANLSNKEPLFANTTDKGSVSKSLEESRNQISEQKYDFSQTDNIENTKKSISDDEKVKEEILNHSMSEPNDDLSDSTIEQTPSVSLQKNESNFSLSAFTSSLKKTANIPTSNFTNINFGQFSNNNTEKSSSPFASFADDLKKPNTPSFSFSNLNISNDEKKGQEEEPNNCKIDENKNNGLLSDKINQDSEVEEKDAVSTFGDNKDKVEDKIISKISNIDEISKSDLKCEQRDERTNDGAKIKEPTNVDNEANELSSDLINKKIMEEKQPIETNIKGPNTAEKDNEVSETANQLKVNDEREDTKIVLDKDDHLDKKDNEVDGQTSFSTVEISTEISKDRKRSENVVVKNKEDKNDGELIDKPETKISEILKEKIDGVKKSHLVDKCVDTTIQSVSQQIQTEPIEYKDSSIQMKEFTSQSCQTDEIKYETFQMKSFEEDENYLAEIYIPLSLGQYYTNANILNIPYASANKTMKLFESTYQQVNAEFQVLEDNLKSMKRFFEDQTTINLEQRTEQSVGNKYTWRIPEVKQLFKIVQKRQLKIDERSKDINELEAKIFMFKKKECHILLQQRDEIKERYSQIDYLKTEVLNNQYAPLSYHQNSLKKILREKMLNLDKQSEEISQCLYISKLFVNYLTDPLNTDIRSLLMSAEYFDVSNKLKPKSVNINTVSKIGRDQIQSLDVVQVGLDINAKKQMGKFFKELHSQKL